MFLNPDAVPRAGLPRGDRAAARRRARLGRLAGARHRRGRTRGQHARRRRPLHGIAWAGGAGEPLDASADRAARDEPGFVSGACLAIPRERLRAAGRLRRRSSSSTTRTSTSRCALRLAGGRARGRAAPPASTTTTSSTRGRPSGACLERNRWATLIRTYPAGSAGAARPGAAGDRAGPGPGLRRRRLVRPEAARLGATSLRWLPRLLRERRGIQATRAIGARRVRRGAHRRSSSSPYLGGAGALARSCGRRFVPTGRWCWRCSARGRAGAADAAVVPVGAAVAVRDGLAGRPRLGVEPRHLLGEDLGLLGEPRGGDREVEQEHEDDPERDQEQRVRRRVDADRVGERRRAPSRQTASTSSATAASIQSSA